MNTIELLRPGRRNGLMIPRANYELLSIFILNLLRSKGEITLTELLEKAEEELNEKFSTQTQWIVLNVKHDLEARDIIKVRHLDKCIQTISLKDTQKRAVSFY
jgi:hypothetical protein